MARWKVAAIIGGVLIAVGLLFAFIPGAEWLVLLAAPGVVLLAFAISDRAFFPGKRRPKETPLSLAARAKAARAAGVPWGPQEY